MLRGTLLTMARSEMVRSAIETLPYTRSLVPRFVAGEELDDALRVTADLADQGLRVTLDHLGEDTHDRAQAQEITDQYLALLERLGEAGFGDRAEASVKLSALGQGIDEELALKNAQRICAAATVARTTVTLDMEDHTTIESTLRMLRELRRDYPATGAVIQAYLRRSEQYCAELAGAGSRVRLCKGAYDAPESVAFRRRHDIDLSYVRCMRTLLDGEGYPMLATHDPRMIEIAGALAVRADRDPESYEYQLLYGIRPAEQLRLAGLGARVRVYVPYGGQWYGYLMRRMAERPANLGLFLRSLTTKR